MVDENILHSFVSKLTTHWIKKVPRKVNVFVWRLRQNRIPVRVMLDHFGVDFDSLLCPCCLQAVETVEH